jgi:hypothetical protein
LESRTTHLQQPGNQVSMLVKKEMVMSPTADSTQIEAAQDSQKLVLDYLGSPGAQKDHEQLPMLIATTGDEAACVPDWWAFFANTARDCFGNIQMAEWTDQALQAQKCCHFNEYVQHQLHVLPICLLSGFFDVLGMLHSWTYISEIAADKRWIARRYVSFLNGGVEQRDFLAEPLASFVQLWYGLRGYHSNLEDLCEQLDDSFCEDSDASSMCS